MKPAACVCLYLHGRLRERLILISAEPASPSPYSPVTCLLTRYLIRNCTVCNGQYLEKRERKKKNQLNAISSAPLLQVNVNYTGLPQLALIIPECLEASSVQKLQELGQHPHTGRDTPAPEPCWNNQDKQDGVGGELRDTALSAGAWLKLIALLK